jgi:cellulose synthase/poly-beta-1,6-N-acetylglucosamine synthase-like glycosyltransferase
MTPAAVLAALCIAWLGFAYVGYPALLYLLRTLSPRPLRRDDRFPPISVILAVHNGERTLAQKLEATLAQAYPGRMQLIVSSDGSSDRTAAIAASFAARGVLLIDHPERQGKEAAQARGIARANGEILVFSDVSSELEPGALRALVRPFADPGVGAVSSEDAVDPAAGEGAYVRYEMALRRLESEATTLIGVSGSGFAIRRELGSPWPTDLASDFRVALEASRRGLRAVAEPAARVRVGVVSATGAEWQRKVRTVSRGIAVLLAHRELLHPRFGRAAFSVWGHKLARFSSPFALLGLLAASFALAGESAAGRWLLALQLAAYAIALAALVSPRLARARLPRLAGFFLLVNAATFAAWLRHLRGERTLLWQPTER